MNNAAGTTLGSRLREARAQKLLSQRELAERAGVSLSLVGQLETGTRKTSPKTLHRLAEVLNVDAVWLEFGGESRAAGEDKYKVQLDGILELVNLLQNPKKERKFLNSFAQMNMALTGLTQALMERQALDDGEIPSMEVELDTLKKIEFHAKSCCACFAELQTAYPPEGYDSIKKSFSTWQEEKQKFDGLLNVYNKMNDQGRKIVVHTATALAELPEYQKQNELDAFSWTSLCHKLKQLREEKHLSQQEVAESCCLREGRIQEIETACSYPNLQADELCRIADVLEVRVTELLPFSEGEEDGINKVYNGRQKWLDEHKNEMDEAMKEGLDGINVVIKEMVSSAILRIRLREEAQRVNAYGAKRRQMR